MAKLPILSGSDVVKALAKAGFRVVGRKGSHIRLKASSDLGARVVIVPDHREIARGTMSSILRQAGLSREEFHRLL